MNVPAGRSSGWFVDSPDLVVGPYEISRSDRGIRPIPTRAMVFSGADGFQVLGQVPSYWQASRYTHRYDVDLSDHRVGWAEELESGTPGFRFQARMHATWRAGDPVAVVRRGLTQVPAGDEVVRQGLTRALRSWTRDFPIHAVREAEQQLNRSYGTQELPLPEGLTVVSFTLHLAQSTEAESIVKAPVLNQAELERLRHTQEVNAGQAQGELAVARIRQLGDAELLALRADVVRAATSTENGLLIHLIAQHPGDMRAILQETAREAQLDLDRKQALFNSLVDQGYIQPADIEVMWQTLMQSPTAARPAVAGLAGAPVTALTTVSLPAGPPPPPAPWAGPSAGPAALPAPSPAPPSASASAGPQPGVPPTPAAPPAPAPGTAQPPAPGRPGDGPAAGGLLAPAPPAAPAPAAPHRPAPAPWDDAPTAGLPPQQDGDGGNVTGQRAVGRAAKAQQAAGAPVDRG